MRPTFLDLEQNPQRERSNVVRWLYGDVESFAIACGVVFLAFGLAAVQSGTSILWIIAAANAVVSLVRLAASMSVTKRWRAPDFDADAWERAHGVLAAVHVLATALSYPVAVTFTSGSFAPFVCFATTLGFLVYSQTRDFPAPFWVGLQLLCAALPLLLGLGLTEDIWFQTFAAVLIAFLAALRLLNKRVGAALSQANNLARRNRELARQDSLTGLPNRMDLTRHIADLTREKRPFALLFFDIERFKRINDTLGHATGDLVLLEIARRFQSHFAPEIFVARFGSDDFVLIKPGVTNEEQAKSFAERVLLLMEEPFDVQGAPMKMGCSVGVALHPRDGIDSETLLRRSDTAMYEVKRERRGGYRIFNRTMSDREVERLSIENRLRAAIQNNQLELHFQPLIDVPAGRVACCEALLRWPTASGKPVPPAQFLPIAEECGLMGQITEWTFLNGCKAAAGWPSGIRVAINLSPLQMYRADLVEWIVSILETTGLTPQRLEIEITEEAIVQDIDRVSEKLNALRATGVSVVLDDFGTGYSNLSYLSRLPIDKVKIDRAFVSNAPADPRRKALLQGLIGFISSLGLEVVLEGIETVEEYRMAISTGHIDQMQGFLLALPAALPNLTASLPDAVPG